MHSENSPAPLFNYLVLRTQLQHFTFHYVQEATMQYKIKIFTAKPFLNKFSDVLMVGIFIKCWRMIKTCQRE